MKHGWRRNIDHWEFISDGEQVAVVVYTTEPYPVTGRVGWCWWAMGDMGEASSRDEAMSRAELSLSGKEQKT